MTIGLGMWRVAGRRRRAGRTEDGRGSPRASVREVCLIGLDRRDAAGAWTAGREVTWLGRTYQVRGTAGESQAAAATDSGGADPVRRYVHLARLAGD